MMSRTTFTHHPRRKMRRLQNRRGYRLGSYKPTADLNERSERDEKELAALKDVKASLEKKTSQLSSTNEQQAGSLDQVSAQRDQLQSKLQDAQQSLQTVRDDLNKLQDERRTTLLQTASLETRIGELTAQLRDTSASSDRQKDFLASDRDIRELMGARQLSAGSIHGQATQRRRAGDRFDRPTVRQGRCGVE